MAALKALCPVIYIDITSIFVKKKNQEQNKSWQDGWIKKQTPDFLSNTMSWDSKQTFRPKIKSQRSSSYGDKIIYILYYIGRRK